jgi:hypothetical protein
MYSSKDIPGCEVIKGADGDLRPDHKFIMQTEGLEIYLLFSHIKSKYNTSKQHNVCVTAN